MISFNFFRWFYLSMKENVCKMPEMIINKPVNKMLWNNQIINMFKKNSMLRLLTVYGYLCVS